MSVLQIGAGGVGGVVAHKLAMNAQTFGEITLASRTLSKCEEIAKSVKEKTGVTIKCRSVDADDVQALVELINELKPKVVITTFGLSSLMSSTSAWTSSASTLLHLIVTPVFSFTLFAISSHLLSVLEARVISPKVWAFMASLWATTPPTPPAPICKTLIIISKNQNKPAIIESKS